MDYILPEGYDEEIEQINIEIKSLENKKRTILHQRELEAKAKEPFNNIVEFCKFSGKHNDDGVWDNDCRHKSNISDGSSWGKCDKNSCPMVKLIKNNIESFLPAYTSLKTYDDSSYK